MRMPQGFAGLIRVRGVGAALVLGLGLAACGNAPGMDGRRAEVKGMVEVLTPKAAPAPLRLSAAAVAASPAPLIELQSGKRSTVAVKVAESHGTASYVSADRVTLGLRDGMLVAVRGLQSDVMSASAPSVARIAAGSGSHMRSYQILDGLGVLQPLRFDCTLSRQGSEQIQVAERLYATQVVAESCRNAVGTFENRYWIDQSGKIRQTNQWIGSGVDFLRLLFG